MAGEPESEAKGLRAARPPRAPGRPAAGRAVPFVNAMVGTPGRGLELAGMRRAKIVATLGPTSSNPHTIQDLLEMGGVEE